MILVQRHVANDNRQVSRALTALVVAMITLFGLVVAIVFLGTSPMPAASGSGRTSSTAGNSALADTPACRAALARARASQALGGREAVAASTAMLRVCRGA
jgi:hypothetical protein